MPQLPPESHRRLRLLEPVGGKLGAAAAVLAACDGHSPHTPHPPTPEGLRAEAGETAAADFPRAEVAEILVRYNRELGAHAEAIANAERIAQPSSLVVATGQQPCAAGGPLYVIYKALTAIRLAREVENALGVPAVPVFWNASEDHDIDEVAPAAVPGPGAKLLRFRADLDPWRGKPIASVGADPRWQRPVRKWLESLPGVGSSPALVRLFAPSPDESWATWFSRVLSGLMGREGLVLVEPQPLRGLCGPIFARAIRHWRDIGELLEHGRPERGTGAAFGPLEGPPVFLEHEGYRRRVLAARGGFVLRHTDVEFGAEDLAALAEEEPTRFSSHAILRPLVQNALLPVAAQVLGPGEMAYQEDLYLYHASPLGAARRMPVQWPRMSATLLDGRREEIARAFGLEPGDMFLPGRELAERAVPKGRLAEKVREAGRAAAAALEAFEAETLKLDRTLQRPLRRTVDTVGRAFEKFGGKLAAAEARLAGLGPERLKQLGDWVSPSGKPQERVFGTLTAALLGGEDVFGRILAEMDVFDRRHMLIRVAGSGNGPHRQGAKDAKNDTTGGIGSRSQR